MLKGLEDCGALQASILKKRIDLVSAAQELHELLEGKASGKTFDKVKYRENLDVLTEKEVNLPWEISCGVFAIEAMDALKALLETQDEDESIRLAEAFAERTGPVVEDICSFDPTKACIGCLLAEMVDASTHGFDGIRPCVYEHEDAAVMEDEEFHEHMLQFRWEAPLGILLVQIMIWF